MPEDKNLKIVEFLNIIRSMIEYERTTLNQRLNWMFSLNGLLFIALGFIWNQGKQLIIVLSILGAIFSLSVLIDIRVRLNLIKKIKKQCKDYQASLTDYNGPQIVSTIEDDQKLLVRLLLPANLLPLLFSFMWGVILGWHLAH